MSAFLRAVSRRIRLAIHRHDPIECWCELTAKDAPGIQRFCAYCVRVQGQPHELWCRRSAEGGVR